MKVKDLIKELQEFPEDSNIVFRHPEGTWFTTQCILMPCPSDCMENSVMMFFRGISSEIITAVRQR